MAALICDICGGDIIVQAGGRVGKCDSCGATHTLETNAFAPAAPISEIALSDDVARLLQKCKTDPKNARKYANLILDIDPDNAHALLYL